MPNRDQHRRNQDPLTATARILARDTLIMSWSRGHRGRLFVFNHLRRIPNPINRLARLWRLWQLRHWRLFQAIFGKFTDTKTDTVELGASRSYGGLLHQAAVEQMNRPPRMTRIPRIVRHHADRRPLFVQLPQ